MPISRSTLLLSTFALLPSAFGAISSTTVDDVLDSGAGDIRFHYDDAVTENPCETIIMVGVGTAMSVTDYDKISTEMVKDSSSVVVVSDMAPGNLIKKDKEEKFAALANLLNAELSSIISICESAPKNGIIIGGHSASGQSALDSVPFLEFVPSGYLGFDPFLVPQETSPQFSEIPGMFWGFERTSCAVNVDKAAKQGYILSDQDKRVFYQIQNQDITWWGTTLFGAPISHCSFTDKGCPGVCGINEDRSQAVRELAGESTKKFVEALASGVEFVPSAFKLTPAENLAVDLFVNDPVAAVATEQMLRSSKSEGQQLAMT